MTNQHHHAAGETCTLRLEGEMTIYHAAEIKDMLLQALEQARPLQVDLSTVTELDSCGMQLLILAKKVALSRQIDLQLINHSPAVIDAMDLFDIGGFFGDPLVISSSASFAAGAASN